MLEVVAGIKTALVNASVTGANSTYYVLAESGAAKPYIIVEFIGGGDENISPLNTRDEIWQVAAVTGGKDRAVAYAQADTIQTAIKAALHEQTITVTGWTNIWLTHENPFFFPDVIAGEPVYYAGGRYRVRLYASS